jgi:arginase family enzyme
MKQVIPSLLCSMAMAGLLGGCATQATTPQTSSAAATVWTPELAARLQTLSAEQRAFLASEEPLRVLPSRARLALLLETREGADLAAFVTDLQSAVAALAYDPARDQASLPLDTTATNFNGSTVLKPEALRKYRRAPGPFSLQRYVVQKGGIPTFAGAPVALTVEDLKAGQVDVAIAGIPQSMSSGNRDARNGPLELRMMHGIAQSDVHTLLDPHDVLNIVDFGDFGVDRMSVERSIDHVHNMVQSVAEVGTVPFLVGGDRSMSYPTVRGVKAARATPLTVVQLGAHYDMEPTGAHRLSDRDALYRLVTEGHVAGRDVIQVGLRGPRSSRAAFEWMREQGVRYHSMAEVEAKGWDVVMKRVLDEAKRAGNPVYVSLDVSVLDPSNLTAAGRAVPGGLTYRELAPLLRRLCAETEIAGFELMDLAPVLDFSQNSALVSNHLMNACLGGMALRKQGQTGAGWLDPLAVDHGQR